MIRWYISEDVCDLFNLNCDLLLFLLKFENFLVEANSMKMLQQEPLNWHNFLQNLALRLSRVS